MCSLSPLFPFFYFHQQCASGYGGEYMCNTCTAGHYRMQQDCDVCTTESSITLIVSIAVVVTFIIVILVLTKYDFKLASVTALVDFCQTVAILGHLNLPWPDSMRWMFKLASVFIFNFQMAAPECYDATWRYDYLWYTIQALPFLFLFVLVICFAFDRCITCVKTCCRRKQMRVIHVNKITPAAMTALKLFQNTKHQRMNELRSPGEHLRSIGGAGSILMLYLYFALLSMAVQVHMCVYLDDDLSVLIAEPSEPCRILYSLSSVKETFQMRQSFYPVLYPLSILSIILYGVGIPVFYHCVFYFRQDKIKLDLWRRAQGKDVEGATWRQTPAAMKIQKVWRAFKLRHAAGLGAYFVKKNPKKIAYLDVRRLFAKVYEDFSPDHASWRLVQLWRKILICAAAVAFAHNPSLSAGLISVILILSFALQMHLRPFMYTRHVFSTEHKKDHHSRNKNVISHQKEERKLRSMGKYHAEHKLKAKRQLNKGLQKAKEEENIIATRLKSLSTTPVVQHSIKHTTNFVDLLLDYNSLEAMNLLFCALLLNIGIMFEGLRSLETNTDGFSFLGVHIQESSASAMTQRWNQYFVGFLESVSWCMFVFFFVLCLASVVVDCTRNLLYHTYDVLRINRISKLHKKQQKNALIIYQRNVLDIDEEASNLKIVQGQLQDNSSKHLKRSSSEHMKNKAKIERKIASATLEKLKLKNKLKKMMKEQPSIIGMQGGPLPSMPTQNDLDACNNDDDIIRLMRQYDDELKQRADPAAQAARTRLKKRLELRRHQLKKHTMAMDFDEQLEELEMKQREETEVLLLEVRQADVGEDEAVEGMTDEDAERMLQRLESEALIKNEGEKEMSLGRERLRRKLLARQKRKMLKEKASLALSQCEEEDEEQITQDVEAALRLIEEEAGKSKDYFNKKFEADQQAQNDKLKLKLMKRHQKKMKKLQKSTTKLEKQVKTDDTAIAIGMGDGDHSAMKEIQSQISFLEQQAQLGEEELNRMFVEHDADTRMLLNQALTNQADAHSKLEQKLQERKRKRMMMEKLGDKVHGHVDVTEIGGVKTSLETLKHRNALKEATARLIEARQQVSVAKEHVGFKKNINGVKEERAARIEIEEREALASGMAELEAQQVTTRRTRELLLDAEVERAKMQALTKTHLEIEMNAILEKHDADTSQMEMHLALEKEKHKRMLENRLERRRRQRIIDNEKKLEQVQVATPVDLETDLQFAQQELEQAQNIADSIMLNFMASQKAMAEVS